MLILYGEELLAPRPCIFGRLPLFGYPRMLNRYIRYPTISGGLLFDNSNDVNDKALPVTKLITGILKPYGSTGNAPDFLKLGTRSK
jgi:hypothetical protein